MEKTSGYSWKLKEKVRVQVQVRVQVRDRVIFPRSYASFWRSCARS